jgi:dTDP-4-dehydrorhamnose reductase
MRILVTGVSGQVGRALKSELRRHDVIAADRNVMNLSRPNEIGRALEELKPELIVNPAAYTAVDQAESEQSLARQVNAIAPCVMANWAATHDVPIIHFSTDYVFDGRGDRPWREDDTALPLSVYGKTKRDGELAVRAAGGVCLIVRSSWIYSAMGKCFLDTITRLARQREILRVLLAHTVALMIGDHIELFRERCKKSGGLVHLAASGETSWHGFACATVEGLRRRKVDLAVREIIPIPTSDYSTPARRPHNSRLELTRLASVFGIQTAGWRAGLEQELDLLAAEMLARVFGP